MCDENIKNTQITKSQSQKQDVQIYRLFCSSASCFLSSSFSLCNLLLSALASLISPRALANFVSNSPISFFSLSISSSFSASSFFSCSIVSRCRPASSSRAAFWFAVSSRSLLASSISVWKRSFRDSWIFVSSPSTWVEVHVIILLGVQHISCAVLTSYFVQNVNKNLKYYLNHIVK